MREELHCAIVGKTNSCWVLCEQKRGGPCIVGLLTGVEKGSKLFGLWLCN